jgi:hypothetical protein
MEVEEMLRLSELLMEDWHLYEEASIILRWARELFPDEASVTKLLVEALSKSGQDEEARRLSNELPPSDDPEELVTHALAQAAAFDHEKALQLLDRAIALAPDEERLYARRGLIRFGTGSYDDAGFDLIRSLLVAWWIPTPDEDFEPLLRGFKKIRSEVKGDPLGFKLIDVWAKLAKKKASAAKSLLSKVKEDHWAVYALRAVSVGPQQQDLEQKYLRLALERAPDEVPLLIRYTRHEREHAQSFEAIVQNAPLWSEAHVLAAGAYLRSRSLDKALEHAQAAVDKFPQFYNSLKIRAEVRTKRHDLQGALADYDELVDSYDDEDEPEEGDWDGGLWREELNSLRCARGRVRLRLHDVDGAREDFDLAVTLGGDHEPWSLFERGRFHAVIGEREKALADLDKGLSRVEYPEALSLRWKLRAKMGNAAGAEADHTRARELFKQRRAITQRQKPEKAAKKKKGAGAPKAKPAKKKRKKKK